MQYNFDRIIPRTNTNSIKWEFMHTHDTRANSETLPFWIADMDFACPPAIIEAIKDRADKLILGYSKADAHYYNAVCSWMARRFAWQIKPDSIFISPGVVPALKNLILCLTAPGDGIIIQRPVYYPFTAMTTLTGRTVVNNALINNNGYYTINFEALEQQAREANTTMMLLCSPHNPVGRVWTEEELQHIGEICLNNNVTIVSDEIHFDLLRSGMRHVPIAKLFPDADTIITCTSPSKSFNTAGMQTSNIMINNPVMREKWEHQVGPEHASPFGLIAVQAAYEQGEEWLDQLCAYLDENLRFMKQFLDRHLPKTVFTLPEGTYLAWIDFRAYGHTAGELDKLLLEKGNILLDGGTMFGPEGRGFQRMNIACPRSILEPGLERMARALQG